MASKHLGIVIAFGPEVRGFLHSGLVDKLAEKYTLTIFTSNPESEVFKSAPRNIAVVPFPEGGEPQRLKIWRYRASRLHAIWMEKQGTRKWRHYLDGNGGGNSGGWREHVLFMLANYSSVWAVSWFETLLSRRLGTNAAWASYFTDLNIDAVITSSYGSERTLPALQTATNMGLKTIIIPNSWKDVFTSPHLPFQPSALLVWSKENASRFIAANPWKISENIKVVGSLHISPFFITSNILSEKDFFQQMGLNWHRPFICYTAAAPKAVKNEELLVECMLKAIKNGDIPQHPQLLLRLNPMEDGTRFAHLKEYYNNDLIIQKPLWEWDASKDWCCAKKQDINLWVSTVFYATCNISIPSTVTLEFSAMKKPVINICFDLPQTSNKKISNRRFWEADFYKEIRDQNLAIPVFSDKQLITSLKKIISSKIRETNSYSLEEPQIPWLPKNTIGKVVAAIDDLFNQ